MASSPDRQTLNRKTRLALWNSPSGVKMAKVEVLTVFSWVEQLIQTEYGDQSANTKMSVQGMTCTINTKDHAVRLKWDSKYKNTLQGSFLLLQLWQGLFKRNARMIFLFKKPVLLKERKFTFYIKGLAHREWHDQKASSSYSSESLATLSIQMLTQISFK